MSTSHDQRWPISASLRAEVVERATQLSRSNNPRIAIQSAKLLRQLESSNQRDEHFLVDVEEFKAKVIAILKERLDEPDG